MMPAAKQTLGEQIVLLASPVDFSSFTRVYVPSTMSQLARQQLNEFDDSDAVHEQLMLKQALQVQLCKHVQSEQFLGAPCVAWLQSEQAIELVCHKAVVATVYKALAMNKPKLAIKMADVKSSVAMGQMPLIELQRAVVHAVLHSLKQQGWHKLGTANSLIKADFLEASSGTYQTAMHVRMEVLVEPPACVVLAIHEAGVIKFCHFQARDHLSLPAGQSISTTTAMVESALDVQQILDDASLLQRASRQLWNVPCVILPDMMHAFIKGIKRIANNEDLIRAKWLVCHGLELPSAIPFYFEVSAHDGDDDGEGVVEVPCCCVWAQGSMADVPPHRSGLQSSDIISQLVQDLATSTFKFWGNGNLTIKDEPGKQPPSSTAHSKEAQPVSQTPSVPVHTALCQWTSAAAVAAAAATAAAPVGKPGQQQLQLPKQPAFAAAPASMRIDLNLRRMIEDDTQMGSYATASTPQIQAQQIALRRDEEKKAWQKLKPFLEARQAELAADGSGCHQVSMGCPVSAPVKPLGLPLFKARPWATVSFVKQPGHVRKPQGTAATGTALGAIKTPTAVAGTGTACTVAHGDAERGKSGRPGVSQPQFAKRKAPSTGTTAPGAKKVKSTAAAVAAVRKPALKKQAASFPALEPVQPVATGPVKDKPGMSQLGSLFCDAAIADGALQLEGRGEYLGGVNAGAPRPASGNFLGANIDAPGYELECMMAALPAACRLPHKEKAKPSTAKEDNTAGGPVVPTAAPRKRIKASDLDLTVVTAKVLDKYSAGKVKDLSIPEMQCFLKAHKQPVGGKKAELELRLQALLAVARPPHGKP